MAARQYDNPLRYLVESHTRASAEHLVELDAFDGNGQCTCEHFRYRLQPILEQSEVIPSDRTRCQHICLAREMFTDQVIKTIVARMPKGVKDGP